MMEINTATIPKFSLPSNAYPIEERPHVDGKVPVIKAMEGTTFHPSGKPFVAQVVTARLSGTAFPSAEAEIAPPERTMPPYGTPMLPPDKDPEQVRFEERAEEQAEKERAAEEERRIEIVFPETTISYESAPEIRGPEIKGPETTDPPIETGAFAQDGYLENVDASFEPENTDTAD